MTNTPILILRLKPDRERIGQTSGVGYLYSMNNDSVLELDGVSKRFGAFSAVDALSFAVKRGEIFGFLGPNGAGKTTTLRMILGIIPPTEGRIRILGADDVAAVRRQIGYLPEERGLYRKMRADDAVAYFARLRGVPRETAHAKARALLAQFGLADFSRSKIEALSKGMAQKVQLLATIAHEPDLLILDEPFSGLDPINQSVLEDLIRDLKKRGRTIIFSTHVMPHAERLCDRFLIIAGGKKRFEGDLAQARAMVAPRLHVRSSTPRATFAQLPGVSDVIGAEGAQDFELTLAADANARDVLRRAIEAGCDIQRFELAGASLHDIFVDLAGETAADAAVAA